MVMIAFGAGIEQISGKLDGCVYRFDHCGQHLQMEALFIDAETKAQKKQRDHFRTCCTAWSNHAWTQIELDSWWIYIAAHPVRNHKGELRSLHPFLMFLHINILRLIAGLPIIYNPLDI